MAFDENGVWRQDKHEFFETQLQDGVALTFDDVRLANWDPQPGVDAADADISSRFTTNIEINTPFVSAAMDTVTESDMAIAMAKLGGIGVVHAGLSVEEQKDEVRRVKHHLNGKIEQPITVSEDRPLESILSEFDDRGFDFRTIPVTDGEGALRGLLTTNDFDFTPDKSTAAGDAMTPLDQLVLGDSDTTIEQAHQLMIENRKKTLPLVGGQGEVLGLYVFSDVDRLVSGSSSQFNTDSTGKLRVAAAVPTNIEQAMARIEAMRQYLEVVVVDTAHGDSKYALQTLKEIKAAYGSNLDVMVGNVSSAPAARMLAEAGADGIKVGQGPGSICTTRIETGIGTPQVTAAYICWQGIKSFGIPICADGGIRSNGDISIALASGAESVMMGGMLAGTDESPGRVIINEDGTRVKRYRGMGSASALRESAASRERYGTSNNQIMLPEGIDATVQYKGSVASVLGVAAQALRKSMSYVGAPNLDHHREHTPLMRITNAGVAESHPHDVTAR